MANAAVRSGVESVSREHFSKVASADLDCIPSSTGRLRHLPGRRRRLRNRSAIVPRAVTPFRRR